jgi:hypothetical protein
MNDKQIADRLVEMGIGILDDGTETHDTYRVIGMRFTDASHFVRDPRVAMAVMERCDSNWSKKQGNGWLADAYEGEPFVMANHGTAEDDSLPRAIILAGLQALADG